MTRPLAVTMGDPAGIGGECLVAAWRSGKIARPLVCVDDPDRLRALGAEVAEVSSAAESAAVWPRALPVLSERLPGAPSPGAPDPANALAVVRSIERAVALAVSGEAAGIATLPIHKKALKDGASFPYPGHTEFLAALTGAPRPVMMLAAPGLRVIPVTIHIPVAEIPRALTRALIEETARVAVEGLRRDFGLSSPRVAVAGLNPHAGEGGTMGREEIETIAPAVAALRAGGMDVVGPFPADTMFHPPARSRYDAALCMYHDQALIPLKMLDFSGGVNVTLGLPIIRVSPDHGTAYDIAGTGAADPSSLLAALEMADRMARSRAR